MVDAKMIGSSVAGLFGCLACLVFTWYLLHGGFGKEALIAMIVCCTCSAISSWFGLGQQTQEAPAPAPAPKAPTKNSTKPK
jgi:hypothetical protein